MHWMMPYSKRNGTIKKVLFSFCFPDINASYRLSVPWGVFTLLFTLLHSIRQLGTTQRPSGGLLNTSIFTDRREVLE